MMAKIFKAMQRVTAAALVVALTACGGGGGGASASTQTITLEVGMAYSGDLQVLHPTTLRPVFTGLQNFTPQCFLQGGTVPTGLTLRGDCTMTGTPTQAGTFLLAIRVAAAGVSNVIDFTFSLPVTGPSNTYAFPATLLTGTAVDLAPSLGDWTPIAGDVLDYTVVGALPPGLGFDTTTGRITGTPTQAGDWPFTVQARVTTAAGTLALTPATSSGAVRTVGLTYPALGAVYAGRPFSTTPSITPSAGPWTYAVDVLPAGLSLDSTTGVISGTPSVVQSVPSPAIVTATQAGTGLQLQATVPFQVVSPVVVQYPARNVTVGQGVGYLPIVTDPSGQTFGGAVLTYSVAAGSSLPPGVTIFANNGFIVGTPTAPAVPGTVEVTVTMNGVTFSVFASDALTVTP